jgi:hypothetical protein
MTKTEHLIIGWLLGILTVYITFLIVPSRQPTIKTGKKITPEWKLTTDGKVVDTIYYYRAE